MCTLTSLGTKMLQRIPMDFTHPILQQVVQQAQQAQEQQFEIVHMAPDPETQQYEVQHQQQIPVQHMEPQFVTQGNLTFSIEDPNTTDQFMMNVVPQGGVQYQASQQKQPISHTQNVYVDTTQTSVTDQLPGMNIAVTKTTCPLPQLQQILQVN